MSQFDLTIFTVATNKYFQYFELQLEQFAKYLTPHQTVQVIVATNVRAPSTQNFGDLSVTLIEIPNYSWPEITLLRYHQIIQAQDLIRGSMLMWLDTDMEILGDVKVADLVTDDKVYFAPHPGFIFDWGKFKKLKLTQKLKSLRPWVISALKCQKGAGTWEENSKSKAFVRSSKRKKYVHGAVWVGTKEAVLKMCSDLSRNIDEDLAEGLIAVWHDESHLNAYCSNVPGAKFLPVHFSAWEQAWQFDRNQSYVISLDKNALDAKLRVQI